MPTRVDQIENILKDEEMEILFARVASNLLNRGGIEEAIKICQDGLKKYPSYAQAHYILAQCYYQKGKLDEARAEYERVLKYDPNHLNSINSLAEIYQKSGLEDIYKEYLLKLFTLDPLNQAVVDQVKQLGQYDSWKTVSGIKQDLSDDSMEAAGKSFESKTADLEKKEPPQIISKPEDDSGVEIEKIDLSQFDNREDDFTTILQGGSRGLRSEGRFDEDSTITFDKFEAIIEDEKSPEEQVMPEERRATFDAENLKPREENAEDIPEETAEEDLSDENMEDLEELDFEEPVDNDDLTQEDFTRLNDTTQIMIEPQSDSKIEKQDSEPPAKDVDEIPSTKIVMAEESPLEEVPETAEAAAKEKSKDETETKQTKIISQTLGEILVSQKKYSEALQVFKALKENQPANTVLDRKIALLQKIILLEKK